MSLIKKIFEKKETKNSEAQAEKVAETKKVQKENPHKTPGGCCGSCS